MRYGLAFVLALCLVIPAIAAPSSWVQVAKTELMVRVTLGKGEPHYNCDFAWSLKLADGTEDTGSCNADIPDGVQSFVACSQSYSQDIKSATLTSRECKAKG
jgi:hypothetical protein